jgi:hypothetical protein
MELRRKYLERRQFIPLFGKEGLGEILGLINPAVA